LNKLACLTQPAASTEHALLAEIAALFLVLGHCSLAVDGAECYTNTLAEIPGCCLLLLRGA